MIRDFFVSFDTYLKNQLKGEWVQALGGINSGIVCVDKR